MKTTMKNTEQNAQHTPVLCAPWHVNGERGQIHDARGSLVCEMPDCFAADFNTAIYERANAIAAAPELLAEMKANEKFLLTLHARSQAPADGYLRLDIEHRLQGISRAIAKATGKA